MVYSLLCLRDVNRYLFFYLRFAQVRALAQHAATLFAAKRLWRPRIEPELILPISVYKADVR